MINAVLITSRCHPLKSPMFADILSAVFCGSVSYECRESYYKFCQEEHNCANRTITKRQKVHITLSGCPTFLCFALACLETTQSVSATQYSRHLPHVCATEAKKCTTMKGLSLPTEDTNCGRKSSEVRAPEQGVLTGIQ